MKKLKKFMKSTRTTSNVEDFIEAESVIYTSTNPKQFHFRDY